jgi:hypothetical protein
MGLPVRLIQSFLIHSGAVEMVQPFSYTHVNTKVLKAYLYLQTLLFPKILQLVFSLKVPTTHFI